MVNRLISIAPMMDWTDRHFRYLARLVSKKILLYTEMVTANAILFGDQHAHLDYHSHEHPVALQLGGSDPEALARAAKIAIHWGYDEINLNVGCPSDRVQAGKFGVCLMREPKLVADCVQAMQAVVDVPVTVKTRIGVDHDDSYGFLCDFIDIVARQGQCQSFTLHARKAWLSGLSPKENRNIPPLNYQRVYQLKKDFSQLEIIINGGIAGDEAIQTHLEHVDGVMLGRAAYRDLFSLVQADKSYFKIESTPKTRGEILRDYWPYLVDENEKGVPLSVLIKPLLGLFQGMPGARHWRRELSEKSRTENALQDLAPLFELLD